MEHESKRWADIDPYWAAKEARAMEQRRANEEARAAREPLPYPNLWDTIDPTKIRPEDDSPEAFARSVREFRRLCRPRPRRRHVLSRTSPDSSPT